MGMPTCVGAEVHAFAEAEFASGVDERLPYIGLAGELLRQQDLDFAAQEVAGGGVRRGYMLGARAAAVSEETGGQDAGVVEYQQIVGPQEFREIPKSGIAQAASGAVEVQHAGRRPVAQRLPGDQFVREVVVEVGDQHTAIMPD